MGRMPRIHIENALYLIVSRGDHDENLFREGSDYKMYLDLLARHRKEDSARLFAYCLTPNSIYLLIELMGESNISQVMHGLNSTYTKHFNSKYKRSGHLFQERYRMVLIEKGPNLLEMAAYINLLPKTLGLSPEPADYNYSSHAAYLYIAENRSNERTVGVDINDEVKEVKGHLKDMSYEDYTLTPADIEKIGNELEKKSIIGSDDFLAKVKAKVESDRKKVEEGPKQKIMTKLFIVVGAIAVIALSALTVYLYARNVRIRENIKNEMAKKEAEFNKKMVEEKKAIYKDMDEKYRADIVSYKALSKGSEKAKAGKAEPETKK